jgi:glycosyltransferase involved in cell wall biosynthesis
MTEPAVTVLMPVYNGRPYLTAAVESVLAQTFTDFELLAVDDGSTDGSAELLADFARRDRRVRVVGRPNGGPSAALNTGLARARGALIARMDGDDVCRRHRLARQVEFLAARPDCVMVGAGVLLIDPDGLPICVKSDFPAEHAEIDESLMAGRWSFVHPSVMMRTQAVRSVGGYRAEFDLAEDHDLALRLSERGATANLPDVLLDFRQHLGSLSFRKRAQQQAVARAAVGDARRRRGLPPAQEPPRPVLPDQPQWNVHLTWTWKALRAMNVATSWKHFLLSAGKAFGDGSAYRRRREL